MKKVYVALIEDEDKKKLAQTLACKLQELMNTEGYECVDIKYGADCFPEGTTTFYAMIIYTLPEKENDA